VNKVHSDAVVVDCHNDLIQLVARARRFGKTGTLSTRWLPALRAGGINVQVLPIFVDDEYVPDAALRRTLLLIETIHREAAESGGEFVICGTGAEIDTAVAAGKIAIVIAFEGSSAVGDNVELFATVFRLGLRMASFSWFGRTMLADGSGEDEAGGRLTRAGVRALAELERLGIVMDISHLSRAGTESVLELATRPVVASHSSARSICNHHRNLDDAAIKGIAATGGVIGINFFPGFVSRENPTVDRLVDHIGHVAETAGIDHVGLGPDFIKESVEELFPDQPDLRMEGLDPRATIQGLDSPARLPAVTDALLRRGFTPPDVMKVLGGNFLRVFRDVMGRPGAGSGG
jgi:membrane dipeptidase